MKAQLPRLEASVSTGGCRRVPALLLSLVLTLPTLAAAQWIDRQGQRVPDTDSMKSVGNFGVQLVLTADETSFRQAWNQSNGPPRLQATDKVRRGGQIAAMLLFHGCAPGPSGHCDALARFTLVAPDGRKTPAGEAPLSKDRPVPGRILLSGASLVIGFDAGDAPGRFRLLATVIDKVSGQQVQLSREFTLD